MNNQPLQTNDIKFNSSPNKNLGNKNNELEIQNLSTLPISYSFLNESKSKLKSRRDLDDKDKFEPNEDFPKLPVYIESSKPKKRTCKWCYKHIITQFKRKIKPIVWFYFILLIFVIGPFALMIFSIEASYYYYHYCPNCSYYLSWKQKLKRPKTDESKDEVFY